MSGIAVVGSSLFIWANAFVGECFGLVMAYKVSILSIFSKNCVHGISLCFISFY